MTRMMRMGWGIFNRSSCATLMDSLVHIIISPHTWTATNTDVKDPSKRCVTEPHIPTQWPLMEPVKKPRAMSSIIDFIPKLLLRTHHALHSNGEPFIGRHTEGENEPELFFFLALWKLKPVLAALFC